MWRLWVFVGALVWLATISASASVNYLAGLGFGRTDIEAHVFAMLGVSADVWKALGPIFIVALFRSRRWVLMGLASLVWSVCFLVAVSAALGLAAENRTAKTGGREVIHITYTETMREVARLEEKRKRFTGAAPSAQLDAAIAAVLARPLHKGGTVGRLSDDCQKDHWRTREACAELAKLREELAEAKAREHLDADIARARRKADSLRVQGALRDADPQAELISRLTFGMLSVDDVGLAVVLTLVVMVELVSAFTPVVLHGFVAAHRSAPRRDVARRGLSRSVAASPDTVVTLTSVSFGDVYEYMLARVVPDLSASVAKSALYRDYVSWCREKRFAALSDEQFNAVFDRIVDRDLGGRVAQGKGSYRGFRIVNARQALLASS